MAEVQCTEKKCGRCKEFKPIDQFGMVNGKHRSYCRPCHAASVNNPDLRTEKPCASCGKIKSVKKFNRLGKRFQPYCKECSREETARRYEEKKASGQATIDEREYYWKRRKWVRLRHKYGIEKDEYKRLYDEQRGVCAVCGEPETDQWRGVTLELAVDHDHRTGKIRGLLCRACNLAIGKLKDDAVIVQRAADYLKKHL